MRTLNKVIIALIFILAGVLFFHSFTSINADIGRHIKLGEIIWQTGTVPKINLLSFTASEYPFINHHWLSEVVFYKIYSLGSNWMTGLKAIMLFKVAVLLGTYLVFYFTVRKNNIFSVVFAFIVSIFVFSARTEARPEIFSYLFFSIYLFIIFRARNSSPRSGLKNLQGRTFNYLWFLPIVQLFWVNTHIYFAMGPIIYSLFLIEKVVLKKINRQDLLIGLLIISANLANPNFIAGALYPLKVLNNYGYSVAENSSLFFLARYFGQWAPQDKLFLISLFILAGSFALSFCLRGRTSNNPRTDLVKIRTFDLLLVAITAALSFKMQRNIPLFALSLWPVMAKNLDNFSNLEFRIFNFEKLKRWLYAFTVFILVISVYFVVSGRFYFWLDSAKKFGLEVSSSAQDGTDFVKINNIQGPVFNNFDIGSYLVWQLYPVRTNGSQGDPTSNGTGPEQRVFVDGRPEAYPILFFENIYKPMQRDERVWEEMSLKYGISYVFFAHTDMTEWGEEFLTRISKDKGWPMVFLNDSIVIFLKNTDTNRPAIDKYKITEDNISEKITQILNKLDKKDDNAFVNFGNALYRFRWLTGSAKVFEALIKNQPDNPYGYQGAGYAYVVMNDLATQQKAADNLKKAIDLGFKTFNNYFTLGIINANLGNFFMAEENIKKALEADPGNQNAKQVLETIRKKIYLQ
mgnify:CR=1 FL=1